MANWGILNLIANNVKRIFLYAQRGIELYTQEHDSKYFNTPLHVDGIYFMGFISDKQDLKFNNSISKILTKYVGKDISHCITDYNYDSFIKFNDILITKKINDDLYLHYLDISKRSFICSEDSQYIEFDGKIIKSYTLIYLTSKARNLKHMQIISSQPYNSFHSDYVIVEEKKSDVVLDLTHKQQEFDITTQVLRSTGEKPEDNKHRCGCHMMHHNNFGLNGYLLRFRMPAIEYIESIQLTAYGYSTKYDKLYMKHIDQLICFDKNIFEHKSDEDDYAISFTNGYFGCIPLRRYSYFTMIINYDESKISTLGEENKKIETFFTFDICEKIEGYYNPINQT